MDGYIHVPDGSLSWWKHMVGILKVGTLAKDRFPHARVRVEVRTREGAFLKVFWYREFRTLDITLSKFEESV